MYYAKEIYLVVCLYYRAPKWATGSEIRISNRLIYTDEHFCSWPIDSMKLEKLFNVRSISRASPSLISCSPQSETIWHMILCSSKSLTLFISLLECSLIHDSARMLIFNSLLIKHIQFVVGSVHHRQPGYITQTKFAVSSQ